MHAIEFEAQTHDGIVQIPPQYQAWQNKTVHVILLEVASVPDRLRHFHRPWQSSEEKQALVQTPQFTAAALKTRNYRFDREQANER